MRDGFFYGNTNPVWLTLYRFNKTQYATFGDKVATCDCRGPGRMCMPCFPRDWKEPGRKGTKEMRKGAEM